jgi:hypothetical protein
MLLQIRASSPRSESGCSPANGTFTNNGGAADGAFSATKSARLAAVYPEIVRGKNNTTGMALVEVYKLD